MKLAVLDLAIACSLAVLPSNVRGQGGQTAELKHILVAPKNGGRTVSLAALSIERGGSYPSVIHLLGNVEIKTPVCIPVGPKSVCDGEMILRADRAEFHEDSGKIDAHGDVTVTPLRHK